MTRGGLVFFLFLDFSSLIALFLLFTYYGFIFPALFLFAFLILVLLLLDLRRNFLSHLILEMMNLPGKEKDKEQKEVKKKNKRNYLPVFLALFVMIYSFSQLMEHGLINNVRAFADSGVFGEFALWLSGFGFIIFLSAVRYYNSLKDNSSEKK